MFDQERSKRIELIARVLLAYVAEDPFGPRPLPPLLDRVRNALRAAERALKTDHEPSHRRQGTAGSGLVGLAHEERRGNENASRRERGLGERGLG